MNKRHLYFLSGLLTAVGLVVFVYKILALDFPLVPETQTHIWNIEAQLSFVAGNKPVKISMFLPRNSRRFAIVNENFISRGFGVNVLTEDGKRKVSWSIRRAKGSHSLYYSASVRRMDREVPPIKPIESHRQKPDFKGAHLEASEALISEALEKSADIDGIVTELLYQINNPKPDENVALLLGKNAAD
jgi:hypothetical protein